MSEFRYKAFISYSHEDRAAAEWLHRSLESYRVPRRLRGIDGEHGPVEASLRPVFMDREDLGAAHSLDHELRQALEASEFLVVLCSPAAVRSRWIDEEIRLFAEAGRWHKVLAVIIDGDPEAREGPAVCFPEALYRDPEGHEHEPLASDMRPEGDGRRLGLQKLIAGILGVPLDLLRRREHQRLVQRRLFLGAAVVVLSAVGLFSLWSWSESAQRRDSGETLVSMKLNELRAVLDVSEDPESLNRLASYDEAERRWAGETLDQGRRQASGRALEEIEESGIPAWESGDLAAAMVHFRNAWLINALLLRSAPEDREALFQLGQAEFWIGQVHFDRAELEAAERAFMAYAEITRRLVQSEPDKPEWVLEMAYALTNLGHLEIQRDGNPDRILQLMQSALEYNQIALVLDPGNPEYEGELGESLTNLASAQIEVCDLDGALATTEASVAHELATFEKRNRDPDHHWNLAAALGKRAAIYSGLGDSARATSDLAHSLDLLETLHRREPDDLAVDLLIRERRARLLRERGVTGDLQEAIEQFALELESWQSVLDAREDIGPRFRGDLIAHRLSRAELLVLAQRRDEALEEARLAHEQASQIMQRFPDASLVDDQLVKASFLAWHLGAPHDAQQGDGLAGLESSVSGRSCASALTGLWKALMEEKPAAADGHARFLASRGYADFSYGFVCSNYSVCEK